MFKEVVKKKMKISPKEFENIAQHGCENYFDEIRDVQIDQNVTKFINILVIQTLPNK